MNGKILKELLILILLFIVVIFTLGMLFFDSINVDVQKIDSVTKKETADMNNIASDIDLNLDNSNEKVNIIKSVSKEDLEKYRQENSYNTGKKNPFSSVSDVKEDNKKEENNNNDNNLNNSSDNRNMNIIDNKVQNTNSTKQDTTGRFFENKSSK